MHEPLPVTLIAGFNSAAKARVIDALLQYKPEGEQWALIAPASLLGSPRYAPGAAPAGLWVETVAPGCPCCTGLTPFSAGLTGLLRRLRDQPVTRLLIEGGNEGHADNVARLLGRAEFRAHVVLTHVLAVIDPAWLAKPQAAAQIALRELAQSADSLVASPWDAGDATARSAFATFAAFAAGLTPPKPWTPLAAGVLEARFARAALRGAAADAMRPAPTDIQPFPAT